MTIARIGTLVGTNWLKQQIGTSQSTKGILRILDTSWLPEANYDGYNINYKDGHIPEAKFFDIKQHAEPTRYIPFNLPDQNRFTDYAQSLGISGDTHVVTYDRFNSRSAVRVWWLFRYYGHNNVSILDGGLNKWKANGFPVTTEEPEYERGNFEAQLNPELKLDYDTMVKHVNTQDVQIMDSREPESYQGDTQWNKDVKPGHMPGAKNIPFSTLFNEDGTYKSQKDLQKLFDQAGIDLSKPVVATCLLGLTACGLTATAKLLGRDRIPVYIGSWVEFGQKSEQELCLKGK